MGWKNWPSWVKGGVILLILGLIANIFGLIIELNNDSPVTKGLGFAVVNLPALLIVTFIIRILKPLGLPLASILSNVFVFMIIYFIIGAFIGWIYGKIKSRGKNER